MIVDLDGDGIQLTSAENGVFFDISAVGSPKPLAWTDQNSDDAWLALDRSENGRIDDGSELFGNYTEQPESEEPNGFLALAVFDEWLHGGNDNGEIDSEDQVFESLRLWRDENKDGQTQGGELLGLAEAGVVSIDLKYKRSKRVDEHGNVFRFRTKVRDVRGAHIGKWAWDVFLQSATPESSSTANQCRQRSVAE